MKIDPAERRADADGAENGAAKATVVGDDEDDVESAVSGAGPLTIELPDGSESVSEAILSHRRMLTNPSDHGLVSADEAEAVRETVDQLAEEVPDELRDDLEDLETSVDELADGLDRQQQQIRELRKTVASLAEILGASVEFQTE